MGNLICHYCKQTQNKYNLENQLNLEKTSCKTSADNLFTDRSNSAISKDFRNITSQDLSMTNFQMTIGTLGDKSQKSKDDKIKLQKEVQTEIQELNKNLLKANKVISIDAIENGMIKENDCEIDEEKKNLNQSSINQHVKTIEKPDNNKQVKSNSTKA